MWARSLFWAVFVAILAYVIVSVASIAMYYHGRIVMWITFLCKNPGQLQRFLLSGYYTLIVREVPSLSYQRFIDEYAVHEYSHDSITYWKFGADPKARPLPELLTRFDWFTQETCPGCPFGDGMLPEVRKVDNPRTVHLTYYDMASVDWLLEAAQKWATCTDRRILVVASGDELLSEMESPKLGNVTAVVARLRQYFDLIWVRAKDIDIDGVRTMPSLLAEEYLRGGVAATATAAMASASVLAKPHRVLAAWSFHYDHLNDLVLPFKRGGLRSDAVAWSRSASARRMGVDVRVIKKLDWWGELAKYQFVLVPPGAGVQSPKAFEALLVLTVPIVQRVRGGAVDDLIRLGFPFVAVDAWDEVTPQNLDTWWQELSPRLVSFRDNCFRTEPMWQIISGKLDRCV